jgi:hypothetical protein
VTQCAIAGVIGEGLGVLVLSLAEDEARTHFDWLARFVAVDNPTSSALTRNSLGWRPREPESPGRHARTARIADSLLTD